jgi:hypothetical protein
VRHRPELEDLLEKEWSAASGIQGPWLGQVANGKWEIRSGFMGAALESVLQSLLADGLVIGINTATGSVSEVSASASDGLSVAGRLCALCGIECAYAVLVVVVRQAGSSPKKEEAEAPPPPKKKLKPRKGKQAPAALADAKEASKLPAVDSYVVANRYTLGEAFKIRHARLAAASNAQNGGAAKEEEEEEEEEEELNEYEMERQQNILRNQAFLQSLGLA